MFATESKNQLYPTPDHVIEIMVKGVKTLNEVDGRFGRLHSPLLEPSAGFGNILDFLIGDPDDLFERKAKKDYPVKTDCYAIEIDYNLRLVLQGKGYKVLATDFLEYPINERKFKTILMNPPFNDGLDHLFHAWELLDDRGVLACLLNAESVLSPINKPRQRLAEMINLYGRSEVLGPVFKDSEHPTDVNVVCVWLKKPKQDRVDNIFEGFEKDNIDWSKIEPDMLVKSDVIKDLVDRYNGCVEILRKRHREQQMLNIYLSGISYAVRGSHDQLDERSIFEMKYSVEDQVEVLKSRFWSTVFQRTKIGQRTTESYRQQFEDGAKIQAHMAFTEKNVKDVLEFFLLNQSEIMTQCVVQVFDTCSRYNCKTLSHSEGWKTNKSYKIGKKIIYPYGVKLGYGDYMTVNYSAKDFYDDLDKACCFLSGKAFEKIKPSYFAVQDWLNSDRSNQCESEFFKMKLYKKGTVHFEFKDTKIVDDFNRVVASVRDKELRADY